MFLNGVDGILGGRAESFALLGFGPLHVALGVEIGLRLLPGNLAFTGQLGRARLTRPAEFGRHSRRRLSVR